MNWAFLILTLLFSSIYCDIYVSKSNCSDETGDGTRDKPYCTVTKALSMANNVDVIHVDEGTYDESIVVPSKDLVIKGASSTNPTFNRITASEGASVALKLENLSFSGQRQLIYFVDNRIDHLVLKNCAVFVTTTLNMDEAVSINATNYDDEIGYIEFTDSIFTTMNIQTSMKIHSQHPLTVAVNFTHNIVHYESIELSNIANFTVNRNEFESKKVKFNSGLVLLHQNTFQRSEIYMDQYLFSNWTENNITDSKFIIDSDCYSGLGLCMNHLELWNNDFFDTNIDFKVEKREDQSYRNITMRNNVFLLGTLKEKYRIQNNMVEAVVDGRENYFGYRSGPTICSNPRGRGYEVSLMVDYSFWCLDSSCSDFNRDPQLLNDTIRMPCYQYKKGTIASIVIFSLIFTIAVIIGVYLYFFKFIPTSTDKFISAQYRLHILGLCISVLSFFSLGLPIAAKAVNSSCQTRVPAPSCVFTLIDSQISSILIMLYFLILFTNIAITVLSSTRHLRQESIFYMFVIIKISSLCISAVMIFEIFTLILDYMSSRVMVVALINLILIIIYESLCVFNLFKLQKNLKEVFIIFDESNEYTQRSLLSESTPQDVEGAQPVADGSFVFYYSDYKQRTFRNLIVELIGLGLLFPFTIWFTVKYIAPGIYSIIVVLFNIGRVVYGITLIRGSRTNLHNLYLIITSLSGLAAGVVVIICGALIYVNIEVNASAFFVLILTLAWGVTFVLSFEKSRTIRNNLLKYVQYGNNRTIQEEPTQQVAEEEDSPQDETTPPPFYENNNYEEI